MTRQEVAEAIKVAQEFERTQHDLYECDLDCVELAWNNDILSGKAPTAQKEMENGR